MQPESNENVLRETLQQALQFHSKGQIAEAEALYRHVLQVMPNNPDALHLLGMVEHQRGNNDLAVDLINTAIQHGPSGPMYCNLGLLLLVQNKVDMALDNFRRAIDVDPGYVTSYINLGAALKNLGRRDEAIPYLQKALSLNPGRADIQVTLDTIQQEKQIENAIASHREWTDSEAKRRRPDMLKPLSFQGFSYNIADMAKFTQGIELIKESLSDKGASLFVSDNVITWNRNYSFLRDDFFLGILDSPAYAYVEKSLIWRTYVLLHFAEHAGRIAGDYVELGCHTGHTASTVISKIDFRKLSKSYFLYDLFEWKEGDEHTRMQGHNNSHMYEDVVKRFSEYEFVRVIKGSVPQSFTEGFPDKIAFAHIDMNHPVPEAGALERVLPRLSRGGVVVLDDYGWWGYCRQKLALDPIIAEHELSVLELPTGQGIVLKP
ncbi:tetratricopeptide repeat protein [Noviherbaspirillum sp.]|jgi:tetratricopeptide (TPR) repeat protein|uniref:tetratricopeptide repeat protein n=1 Tax=Noviherbaspirillum sp. TaxID=1926288 RepID=UPI0025E6E229|nr:tetratricopeptide repeat protein [Noviherbaspirillum sp.]